jgi:hypothetical protein
MLLPATTTALTHAYTRSQDAFNRLVLPRGASPGSGLRARVLNPFVFSNDLFYELWIRGPHVPFCPAVVHVNYAQRSTRARSKVHFKLLKMREVVEQCAKQPPPPHVPLAEMDLHWNTWWCRPEERWLDRRREMELCRNTTSGG